MKFPFALILCLFTFVACQDSNSGDANQDTGQEAVQQEAPAETPPAAQPTAPTEAAQTKEPAQNASGTWHFVCPKGCEGGAGSATDCPKCGAKLVHNQNYH